jgi:hypothetical protein
MIYVTVKCGVLFEVRTEFLNIIYMSAGFKGLMKIKSLECRLRPNRTIFFGGGLSQQGGVAVSLYTLKCPVRILCG